MALGPNDLKQIALPSYWDAATLEQIRLATGETYAQVIADINTGLTLANRAMVSDPLIAGLISTTQEAAIEYPIGVSNGFVAHTEYGKPDARRGATTGHMLPLDPWDRGLGWTWDFLRKARRVQLDADISSALLDLQMLWPKIILTRLFKETYTAVGSAGRSMPLADGGTADAAYVPTYRPDRAAAFVYTHDHITPLNGITQANIETAISNLWEHGYDSPYEILASEADIASWTATATVTGFVPKGNTVIQFGSTQDIAMVGPGYIGAIATDHGPCLVRTSGHVPTTYWAAYKSYGPMDPRNPLVVRYGDLGLGAVLLSRSQGVFPLEEAQLFCEFGVGVMDRTGAVAVKNTGSSYSDPSIV
jgi:hypothetical protein